MVLDLAARLVDVERGDRDVAGIDDLHDFQWGDAEFDVVARS
jgi:hypothetical protein